MGEDLQYCAVSLPTLQVEDDNLLRLVSRWHWNWAFTLNMDPMQSDSLVTLDVNLCALQSLGYRNIDA